MASIERKFNINKSNLSQGQLLKWIVDPLTDDLACIPGIGPATQGKLAADGITTTFQLIGKFLSGCNKDASTADVCDTFWAYLESVDAPPGYRSGVTHALLEKVSVLVPERVRMSTIRETMEMEED